MPTKEPPDSDNDSDVVVITDRGNNGGDNGAVEEEGEDDDIIEDSDSAESLEEDPEHPSVVWTGYGKRTPVLIFRADALVNKTAEVRTIGEKYHMAYKMVKTECKLIRTVLSSHGFHEAHPNSNDFNLMWTGSHLKPYTLRGLQEFQKVNHFPRSYEITRKDRLYKNIQRMQQIKGYRHFDFIPASYIIPGEFQDFCSAYLKDKGPWIVKPVASSRGRGIFLVNHPEQVPLDDTMIVSRYLHNPLLIDGFKFDVRLYVTVTSYDPLIVYMYEEGLTRFATVKYDKNMKNIRNQCMHLTNYSVNKRSNDYVRNDDPDVEDYGNKWSLGAMLRYLRSQGRDTTAMMLRVEDVIIKTLLSAELPIATACKMFMPFRGNCFEVYGFDILIDDNLRPWVLEVNLSPSLACDSPLDLKIKSNMISDLFSLCGVVCHDPMVRKPQYNQRNREYLSKSSSRTQSAHYRPTSAFVHRRSRPQSASSAAPIRQIKSAGPTMTGDEIRMVRRAKEEYARRGGWIRIFPTPDSWELYGSFIQSSSTNNFMLYQQLFPERAKLLPNKPLTAGYMSSGSRSKTVNLHREAFPQLHIGSQRVPHQAQVDEFMSSALQRSLQYERKLSSLGERSRRARNRNGQKRRPPDGSTESPSCGSLVQGMVEETSNSTSASTEPPKSEAGTDSRASRREDTPSDYSRGRRPTPTSEAGQREESVGGPGSSRTKPRTSPTITTPPPQLQVPRYKVVELLEKGYSMSKVQARFAFATYLTRVQHRLMAETGSSENEDIDTANEQMDLVLRFLKRAAGNLQQAFKVVVPSRKLALNDRRRILAKQLGDFVHIYNKESDKIIAVAERKKLKNKQVSPPESDETDQLRQRAALEKKHMRRPPHFIKNESLDEVKFNQFVNMSVESELEEVLTTYTRLNKSASIFLGSNAKSTYDPRSTSAGSLPQTQSQSETSLIRRKEMENAQGKADGVINTDRPPASGGPTHPNSLTSYASAVSIYSAKLAPSTRQRPVSASNHGKTALVGSQGARTRPMSASMAPNQSSGAPRGMASTQRERPDGAESFSEQYDEVINSALQRLAMRQQQRQYTANKASNVLPQSSEARISNTRQQNQLWAGPHEGTGGHSVQTNVEHYQQASREDYSNANHRHHTRLHSANSRSSSHENLIDNRRSNTALHVRAHSSSSGAPRGGHSKNRTTTKRDPDLNVKSANDTFNIFIDDMHIQALENGGPGRFVASVNGENTYNIARGSHQHQQVSQQMIKQKQMMEASKSLLEQSKAKHQAMVAQAHAAQKKQTLDRQVYSGSCETIPTAVMSTEHTPKPPSNPASNKKPSSTHRIARPALVEDGCTSTSSSHFYNSVKYDNSTGTSRLVYSSGYNTGS